MSHTIQLVPKQSPADEIKTEALAILLRALEKTKAGEISEVIVILKQTDGHWMDERSGTMSMSEAVGKLEIIKHSWITTYLKSE